AVHCEARTIRGARDAGPQAAMPLLPCFVAFGECQDGPPLGLRADLAGLARLAADALARVLHALRLVRVWHPEAADLRGDLAHGLLVRAGDTHLLRRLEREADARGRVDLDRVRVAERELQ